MTEVDETVEDSADQLSTLGWREWVGLPDHGVEWLKVKVDTGARTSSLHAFDQEDFERDGTRWVRFSVHPWQRSVDDAVTVEAPVLDERVVRSSSGDEQLRVVVAMSVRIAGDRHEVEFTLTRRDAMGFRMLLGREALRGRYLVDPGRSYLGGRPPRQVRRRNRGLHPAASPDALAGAARPRRADDQECA